MDVNLFVEMEKLGEILKCIVEGLIVFDVVFDVYVVEYKGIKSNIVGDVDLLVFLNIEVGNILGKLWFRFNKVKWVGIVLGVINLIILGLCFDIVEIKINLIVLVCLVL